MDPGKLGGAARRGLVWNVAHTVTVDAVGVEISRAMGRRAVLYSYRFTRKNPKRDSQFFRPEDGAAIVSALAQVEQWIMEDRRGQADQPY